MTPSTEQMKTVVGRPHKPAAVSDLLVRVQAEYREMPGLSLTMRQAERLWNLDSSTCGRVLELLIDQQFLRRTAMGFYIRESSR